MSQQCIALLGRRDEPTDALEEYCKYLNEALKAHGIDLQLERVQWAETGWSAALHELVEKWEKWRKQWVFVQFTALGWSARGFPSYFKFVLKILREAGAHVGVVFHDVVPYEGKRLVDRLRRRSQLAAMRGALRNSELAVFAVPLEKITWMKEPPAHALFIPVGANLPAASMNAPKPKKSHSGPLTVAVFGITGGDGARYEIKEIAEAIRVGATEVNTLRLVVLGRNSGPTETELRKLLSDVPVEVRVRGVLDGDEVVRELSAADVLLFVRGHISTRRGSAIAGIACGLPVIACAGAETAGPITEAGLELYEYGKRGSLASALIRVLKDDVHRATLAAKSRSAQEKYFSWSAIANQFAQALGRKSK